MVPHTLDDADTHVDARDAGGARLRRPLPLLPLVLLLLLLLLATLLLLALGLLAALLALLGGGSPRTSAGT